MTDGNDEKSEPKLDGSGKGERANKGRGGCADTESEGKGRNPKKDDTAF